MPRVTPRSALKNMLFCTTFKSGMPNCKPFPSSRSKFGVSCGVLMIRMSLISASISALSG
jgi:hypothetical protein